MDESQRQYARLELLRANDNAKLKAFGRVVIDIHRWQDASTDDAELLQSIGAYAKAGGWEHGGVIGAGDEEAMKRFNEVTEMAASYARSISPEVSFQRLSKAMMTIVNAWPAITSHMRDFLDLICRRTPPPGGNDIWRTFVELRSRV